MMTEERTEPVSPEDEAAPRNGQETQGATESVDDLEALRVELEQTRQQFLRARADYQNLQRRAQEERQEFGRYQLIALVLNFLPVLDDLERAIDAATGEADVAWLEGVRLVEQKFRGVLEAAGVEETPALGESFDPERHEAAGPAPGPEGEVVHVVLRGYTLNGRVIRPAMVLVGSGEDEGAAGDAPGGAGMGEQRSTGASSSGASTQG